MSLQSGDTMSVTSLPSNIDICVFLLLYVHNVVTKKENQILGIVRQNIKFRHKDIVARLYKQMVRPHLEYAAMVKALNPYFSKDKFILETKFNKSY